nr:MAG TPA: Cytosine specific methyltransferase [Caudoviricetes sp.]
MAERPLYTLYKNLKAQNYDVPDDYNKFESALTRDGKGGADNRHAIYENLKAQNFDVPSTYERFYSALFEPRSKTSSRAKGGSVPMSAADRARFSAGAAAISASAQQTMNNAGRYNRLKQRKQKQQKDFGRVNLGTHKTPYGGDATNVVKDNFAYNPETGKTGAYVTSNNENVYSLPEAEQSQAQDIAYQNAVDTGEIPSAFDVRDKSGNYDLQENINKNGTYLTEEGAQKQFDKKLEDAYARKKEIEAAIAEDHRLHGNPLLSYSASIGASNGRTAEQSDYSNKLATSLAFVNEQIGALEAVKQYPTSSWGEDALKALDNTAFTTKTWDFGLTDFATMGQMERIKTKMDNNIPLSGSDKMLLKSKLGADAAAALEDEKMGNIYRWTKIAGQSLPFMADFFLTGGYGGITKGISRGALKFAAKRGMGKVSAAILKNTGIVAGDVIGSYAMAGTEQALKTGADIMQRHLGNLYQDEKGDYKFGTFDENGNLLHEGGESMGTALYKGLTSAMVENYTEKLFGHNYGIKRGAINFMEKHGMNASAEFFKNIGKSGWYTNSKKWMEKFGINGFAEEVMEEEIGIPLHALLDGDNKFSDLLDTKQQLDIIGGMAISVGSMYAMGAGSRPVKGIYNRAQYYRFRNKVNVADNDSQNLMGDNWADIKDKIDNATNEQMGGVLAGILRQRDTMTKEQINAAVNYGINLMKMRGYNIAKTAEMNAKEITNEPTTPEEQHQVDIDNAYSEGHDADDADKHDIQIQQEDQMKTLAAALSISEQQLSAMSDEELESLTGQDDKLDQAIYDYQLSSARYQGMIDDAQDKVDLAAHQAEQRVDMYTDQSRGSVRNATIKASGGLEDYGVYIISGNIATHDDGSIDVSNSDDMILYYDPTTNSVEHADALMFAELGEELPAADVKAQAINDAKENVIKKVAGIIDGTVEVGSQFSVTDADGTEHTYEVLADNGDGTAMITIDGNVPTELVKGENVQIPYSFADLQQMKDMEDKKRLEAAKDEREQMENERAAQQNQETEQTEEIQPSFDFTQILNDNGNVVLADVLGKDGNTKYPNSQLFLIRDSGAKAKVMELTSDGSLIPHAVNKKDVRTATTMTLDEYKQAMPATSMIEDNSGVDRGEIEVEAPTIEDAEPIGTGAFGNIYNQFKGKVKEAFNFLMHHKSGDLLGVFHRDDVGDIDLVWGNEKMGLAHILGKHVGEGKDFETPDDAIAMIENVINSGRIFQDNQNRYTLMLDGVGVGIRKSFDGEKKNWIVTAVDFNRSQEEKGIVTNPTSTSHGVTESESAAALNDSDGKDINNSANDNENNESLTFEDGTPIPVDENGETDLSQTDAAHAAEWYDNNLGEDADDWLDGEIKKAKKVLEQAQNKKVTGTKPSELVASKKEKEAAIADAQAHYDSAISIRDSLKERRIAKVEDTAEGRKELIEKARRKFARLKSAVKDDAEAVAQLYKETVGTLLHRLYDGTGIDVTDTIPLTAEEYVASNLGAHSLNYEGTETSKGVKQETGLSREDFAKTQLLAADGKGTTIDALVHSLWENRPSNLDSFDTQDIRNVLLSIITSGFKASEARNYIENLRIAQAENILEEQKKAADNAAFAEENKAESESQTETAPESEEKTREENSDEENDEENEKINEQTNENINAPEVPEDATDDAPLGAQREQTDLPFSARDNGTQQTTSERAADVEKNKVDDVKVVDNIVGEKTRKAFERLAKMMGADIQWQYSDKLGNGWIQETTDADGNVHRTIFITLDSSITEGAQFIFGHEMTHQIKNRNPAAYNELTQLVLDTYGSDAFDKAVDETMQRYSDAGFSGRAREYYAEEVMADAVGEMIRDLNLAHTLAMKMSHPLLAAIHEILQKIKLAFFGTEYSDVTKNIIRSIEQAYVKTAKGEVTNSETGEDVSFSLRQKPEPKKKGIGYKVFVLKDGKLYPPMVANPNGAATPVGVWLDADAAPIAGESKTGRPQVKQGGKGTQGGSGKLAYRPGWHLGVVPYAIQFNRKDADGNKTLFPKNFVFAEVEYAADVDYQEEARQEGINPSGKYQHSLAGLKHLPTDGYYMYRTNPNPETDPWVITGAMKVNRILTRAEQAELVKNAGREPQQIQEGDIVTDDVVNSINQEIAAAPKFSLKVYHGSGADFTEFDFDHMGEGAGSQAFGWGGYVTSSEEIGKSYANLSRDYGSRNIYKGDIPLTKLEKAALSSFIENNKNHEGTIKEGVAGLIERQKALIAKHPNNPLSNSIKKRIEVLEGAMPKLNSISWDDFVPSGKNLYEVDIPEDNGSNYLEWEKKPSDEVATKIIEGLYGLDAKILDDMASKDIVFRTLLYDYIKNADKEQMIPLLVKTHALTRETTYDNGNVEDDIRFVYNRLSRWMGSQKAASQFLSSLGFTGIKYPAGTIMGGVEGDEINYVIFKPEDMRITEHTKFSLRLKSAIEETETNPSDAQKESGNYKKGHIKFGGYDYTIENPKGSTRSGKDADGKEWKVTMHDTYGYIRGKFGKDGDHLDMFINDKADLDNWNGDVFVVDQVNPDGSFDEHKVMYGYDSMDDAKKAYLANYSKGWKGLGNITGVSKGEFDKWLDSSNRKLKPFADYAKVKFSLKDNQGNPLNQDGTLKLDKIKSVDELTDEDFLHPTRNVELPRLPKKIADAIGTEGKPVVIKKNIFERNYMRHKDVTPELSKVIFKSALYNPDLYGQNQKKTRPYNWVLINTKDEKGNNRTILLEVNPNKDNVEIVHWHFVNDKNLGLIKKQAIREGDQVLILPSEQSEEVGGLSNLTDDLSAAKIDNSSETTKENGEKFSLKDEKTMFGMHNISVDKLRKAIKQGGFAAPSMGVVDSKNGIYSDYGEITLIPKAEKLAKRTGKNAGTFTADAWTPTYPQVERIMNKQGEKAFNTDMNVKLGDVDNGIYSNVRESWKGYLSSGDVRDGLYWQYLFDKGMNPETIYQTGKYDNDITNEVMRISDNGNKTDYTDKEVAELIQLMNKATGKDNDVDAQREKLKARIASAEKQGNHLLVALKKKRLEELEGVENFYIAADFVNDVVHNNRKNGKVDVHDTMSVAKEKVENDKKLSADFPSWLDKKTEEYGVEEMLYNGTTPSGKPKYIPNTIDNAVKLMKKQGVAGGYTAFGSELGVFIAKNSPEVNTLAAMKNAKDKLIPFGDERHNQIKDKITKEFLELSDEIRVGSNNRYAFDDSGVSRMVELTDHKGNEKEYLKKAYNIEVSDEWMDRYNKLLDTIKKDYKVFYFETKFMRPYGLDEFEKAIVPNDTPSDVVDALKNAGIDVSSYERGNAEDRQKVTMDAINSSDNIRFSLAGERGAAAADKADERTFRMDNLSVAKDMEKNKKKAKAIKAATGWERGADGKWRYEMPDVVLRDPKEWVNKKALTLSDIVEKPNDLFKEYPELFDAYPELKDMKILKGRAKSGGVFYNNAITLNLGDIREAIKYDLDTHYKLANNSLKKTLVHEIQHYIQEQEGFAQGGNSEMIVDKNALDAIAKLRAEKDAVAKEFYAMSPAEQQKRKYEINNRYNDLTKQIERLEKSSRIGYDGYKRLAGEVEARNVSARLNMTPEERRKTLAESTEDVARKDQIFLGVGDVSFSLRDMADGKESGAADMAEDLKGLNTPDEVDDAIKTAIDDMPSCWQMANKKMIHIAQALGENRKAEIAGEEPKFSLKDGSLIKAGTYFSGGGLVEEGLKGIIDPVVAVEYDEKISGVYRNNFGQHIVTADVRDVDPKELVKQIDGEVEYFHASPVCKNYSQAKSNHAEVELDKETAASTAEFINAVKPKVVTIENVKGYKDSDAMKIITDALDANGYTWDADVYNAADYGGYTNRERLIVRSVRDGKLPEKPKKMAHKSGWYEAVADIIPTLTEKKNGVAPWMDVRLKADGIDWRNIDKPLYVMGSAYADGKVPHAFADELLPTLRTKSGDVIVMPDGKVYRSMGRVLARVSGVSDDYKMPFSENLSHTIIGNGIPTQLTEHVIAPLLQNTLRPTTPEDGNTKFSLRYDQFEHDLNQWKKDNNLPKDAKRPTIPQRNAGESAVDFLRRVDEYRKQMALWKTAPTYEQHLLSDDTALGEFNRELQRGSVLKRIAFQDSMLAIRKAQEAIMKEVGVDRLNMAEDAYTAENRSHGKGKNEFEEYNNEFLQPLRKAYHQMKKILGDSYDNVRIYMMAKHGLERDAQMAFKKSLDADFEDVAQRSAAYRAYKGDMNRITNDSDLEFGRVDFNTWRQRDNALRTKYSPSYMDYRYDENGIAYDYSGLSALFGGSDFEEAAHKLVRDIESSHVADVQDLWNATNAATKKILRDGYKAGMMSKDTYLYVRDMYSHYIPLRGWDGTTADQVWDYVGGGKGAFNQTLKTAHGRTSIADDPIAYIENMAESGILLNNKNWVKQHLMLLAQNHPTSLLTLSKAWYVKSTDANGNEEWIPATPQITSQMNSNQVKAAIDAFEQKMENMAQTGDATQQRDGLNIAYPQTHSEEREHEVRVMKDGEEYVIYVNGDPQLAQAMNNTRAHRVREIQSGKLDRAAAWLGRKMASAYTSLSPLFIPSNYFRDLTMTLASTAIREDAKYNYLLRKNLATSWNLGFMLRDYQNGKLREKVNNGNATPKEQMFYDFMMNGGETGFVSSLDVEDLKKKFKNDLKDLDKWKANPVKVGHAIMYGIEFLNRAIEDSNRFAVYMTSIQYGRSIDEAVNDAKDVTLNFNRKGTGEYGWQMIRNLYLFINPAVQSLQTLGALAKHHPFKFTAVTASWLVSGVLVPLVNAALMNLLGGDDDKDKYWQFTKWDRRNNLIMWVPFTHEYVKIPLAQEFRAFYGVGDMIASKMMGGELAEESWSQYAEDLLGQVVDMLPLDPTGYDGNIAVSLMPNAIRPVFELAFNVDFTGKPLFKETEYNKYDPNFTKAYVGTPDWLVRASKMVNSIGNDYPDVQQNSIDAFGDPRYNLNNPAVVDHVLSSYLGGAYTMGSQVLGLLTKSLNDRKEIKMADIPVLSKFVSNPDDRPVTKKQGDEFWDMKENHDRAANTLSKLKKQAKVDGDYSMLERFYDSEEYKQYKQDDVKVKKYEEDKKKERAEESGEEYRPHKLNAEDIYKAHATPKDDFEDLKLKQLYTKLNGFKTAYDLLVDTAPSQSDGYYNTNKAAIDAIDEISLDKQKISELKKGFLDDGKDAYNAEDMKQIRELRKKILAVLEKANKVVVANQKEKAGK